MRASKTRYQLFLPDDLSERLETLGRAGIIQIRDPHCSFAGMARPTGEE